MSQNPSSPAGKKEIKTEGFVDVGYSIPETYGDDRIVILPRDPYWLFAYWEITEGKRQEIKSKYGSDIFEKAHIVLRIHDVTEVKNFNGNNSVGFKDNPASLNAQNWYIRVDFPGRSWCVELGLKTKDGKFILLLRSNIILLPADRVSDITDEQWMLLMGDYDRLMKLSGVDKIGVGSLEMTKLLAKRWEMLNVISSGAFSGVSSFRKPLEKEKKFWLIADAELIIYGATEPTATLTVSGKPVKLNPDGTFSLRFAFPDGFQEHAIKAVSEDGVDERHITITAERKTK
ncbi:MAG TPA: hypothetical protein DCP53_02565 [Elusimicrobia bacterium]|nr:MAG: hypothetical protein A2551_06920 [Elusimicrobia bacterium RIFOXYD2_FULL_34_30]HAM38272.1 hypothetical protein [Elusimicrobiota bacterium]